jgi:hypothetical protein
VTASAEELVRRVRELDEGPWYRQGTPSPLDDLDHLVDVLGRITSRGPAEDIHVLPRVSGAEADAIVDGCQLLTRLEDAVPEIVAGPIRRDAQYWMRWGEGSDLQPRFPTLDRAHFVDVATAPEGVQFFRLGLHTSTGVLNTYGMWHVYLAQFSGDCAPPWSVWAVEPEPDAIVHEVTSAQQWVDLVTSHPRAVEGVLYPDWRSIVRDCDAVHVTLRAIVATQGLYFPTARGEVAPTFWGVEFTLWLRWCFRSVRHAGVADIMRGHEAPDPDRRLRLSPHPQPPDTGEDAGSGLPPFFRACGEKEADGEPASLKA